jgi:hypothetical protein
MIYNSNITDIVEQNEKKKNIINGNFKLKTKYHPVQRYSRIYTSNKQN